MKTSPTALVTGASSGIGRELARILAEHGYDLVIVARRFDRLQELKTELETRHHIRVHVIKADLSDAAVPDAIKRETERLNLTPDVLVNDAGFGAYGDFVDVPWQDLEGMVRVNVLALMHLTQLFLPDMIQRQRGNILNIGSIAGYLPGPSAAVYHASKSFVISFSEALWKETHGSGVTVTCLNPGLTHTEFHDRAHAPKPAFGWMSARRVAEAGYSAMVLKKRVAHAGWMNALIARILPFVPRALIFWGEQNTSNRKARDRR